MKEDGTSTDLTLRHGPDGPQERLLVTANEAFERKEYAEAVPLYLSLLETSPSPDESGVRVVVLHRLGELYTELGDYSTALDYYLQCLVECEAVDDYELAGAVLHSIGVLHGINGDYSTALDYLGRSIDLFRETGAQLMEVKAMANLGAMHLSRGDVGKALEYELRALTVYDVLGDRVSAAAAMINIGHIHEKRKEPDIALSFYLRASESLEAADDHVLFATALLGAGTAYYKMGQFESARFTLEQGLAIATEIGDRQLQYRFHDKLSSVLEALGNNRTALEHARAYIRLGEDLVNQERQRTVAELQMRFDLERRMKEEELRRQHDVTRAVVETQEAERLRIAGDLHDGVGQLLAALRMNLLRLESAFGEPVSGGKEAWERSVHLLNRAASDVRTISHNLGSSTLRELGIEAALREVVAEMSVSDAIRFTFESNGVDRELPEDVVLGLFRVAQELIANLVRHAGATEAYVQLMHRDDAVVLMVEDNGVGFDTTARREGMGTRNIEARVRVMNGIVRFDSQPGHGTTVTVEVKLGRDGRHG